MLRVVFTVDYEIHGNGDGCPKKLMIEPTDRMLRLFDRYGARLTIMADVAEILKFREYKLTHGHDAYHYDAIVEQLCRAVRTGHDVQLHIHSSYFNARHEQGCWTQDWSEYDFANLPLPRMNWMVGTGKRFLELLLKPMNASYRCLAFRAANWSMCPSSNAITALLDNGIAIDTSVFKYGQRDGIVRFDYASAHSALVPWPVKSDDICARDEAGQLWEVPIYSERRWIGAFVTPARILRVITGRRHRLAPSGATIQTNHRPDASVRGAEARKRSVALGLHAVLRRHAWKADFNQCAGSQLIKALGRASRQYDADGANDLPFVLIGHSKLFNARNESRLEPFLAHANGDPDRFGFTTLGAIGARR